MVRAHTCYAAPRAVANPTREKTQPSSNTYIRVETSGAIGRHAARALRYAARTANKKHGCDRTKYSRIYHTPYLAHHARAISGAAVFSDAAHIELGIMFKKQHVAPAPVDGETDRI